MSQSIPIYVQPASARNLHSPAHSLYNNNINNTNNTNNINHTNNSGTAKSTYRSTSSTTTRTRQHQHKSTHQHVNNVHLNINESFNDRDREHHNTGDLSPSRSAGTHPVPPMDYDSRQHQPVRSRAQDLSPIKPSFVNIRDDQGSANGSGNVVRAAGANQFGHSTPNHHQQLHSSPKYGHGNKQPQKQPTLIQMNTTVEETTVKKETIVKELAVNILELNNYRSRTEELDNKLKSFDQLKRDTAKSSPEIYSINEKSEVIKNELCKLKSEMLKKIEDIHELEVELVQIEGHNTSSKINRQQINNLAHRNEEVMNEIRRMLSESQTPARSRSNCQATASRIIEEYSREAQKALSAGGCEPHALQRHLEQRFDLLRAQIEQEYQFLTQRCQVLHDKFERSAGSNANNANNANNEIECLKTLVQSAKDKYERERNFLYKDFESDVYLSHHFARDKADIESLVARSQANMAMLVRSLSSTGCASRSASAQSRLTGEGCFLTEEEEAIRKISERIFHVKSRLVDGQQSSGDEADTKELAYLNEQIKAMKARMLAKGDRLHEAKQRQRAGSHRDRDRERGQLNTTGSDSPPAHTAANGPVYLPVSHVTTNRRANSSGSKKAYVEGSFKAEPVQVCVDSHSGSTHFFHQTSTCSKSHSRTDRHAQNNNSNKQAFFAVDKTHSKNISCSPDRKYMSTVEVPAEQLELMKRQKHQQQPVQQQQQQRSRSLSSSSSGGSSSEGGQRSQRRLHHSAHKTLYIDNSQRPPAAQQEQPKSENGRSMLQFNLEQSQKEIEALRRCVHERNQLIERQRLDQELQQQQLFYLSENKACDLKSNQNLLSQLENQQQLILEMKAKLNQLTCQGLHSNTDQVSAMSENLGKVRHKVRHKVKQSLAGQQEQVMSTSEGEEEGEEGEEEEAVVVPAAAKRASRGCSQQVVDTSAQTSPKHRLAKANQVPAEAIAAASSTALICNIPEHHSLEDMVHKNQETIQRLSRGHKATKTTGQQQEAGQAAYNYYADDLVLLEKRAEFEALDLAINNRKQQLLNLEIARNRRFGIKTQAADQSMSFSTTSGEGCNEAFLRDEIWQLEETVQQRHRELGRADQELKQAKRELAQAREGRNRADKDTELLAKRSAMLSKEVAVFDRKAEEATVELLMAQEQLENARHSQRTIEANVDALKMDLFGYLKSVQAEYKFGASGQSLEQIIFGSQATQFQMRYSLKDLDGEIQARKAELATLKDRSRELAARFQEEEARHGEAMAGTRRQHEHLGGQVAELEADLEAKQALLDEKAQLIEQLEASVDRLAGQERHGQQRCEEQEARFADKCAELENAEKLLAKYMDNLESMRGDEADMVKGLEKASADIQQEKENYDRLKQVINDLVNNKNQMEAKCQAINEVVERVGDEYEKREQQLIKLNNQVKERQAAAKRDRDEAQEAEAAREGAQQELAALRDRHRRKRVECERLEQNCALYETRLGEQEQEAAAWQQKVGEAKRQWEALGAAVDEADARLKDLEARAGQQQARAEQAQREVAERRGEAEELEAYVQQLRAECQREKKSLNGLQTEMLKQKKVYEELKAKSKNCTRLIAGAEADMERAEQMQEKIKAKDSYIIELENCILEKNKEMSLLQQSFLKNQEQTAQFQERLNELEEQTRNTHVGFENDLQNFLNNFSDQESDYLTDTQPPFNAAAAAPNTKWLLNNLLVTPSLRKAYSNNLVGMLAAGGAGANGMGTSTKENCNTGPMAPEFSSNLFHQQPVKLDKLSEKTNLILDEQERYKEALLSKFSEKMSRLDQSQRLTKSSIDSLKSNLGEIERLTANNIFKITSISSK